MDTKTYWQGESCKAKRVTAVLADSKEFPLFWGRSENLVGQRVDAVEVIYATEKFYLYDGDGSGWAKVTNGFGSPSWGHKSMTPVDGTVTPRQEE